nr:MAG TPA: hypothetical protein [Caudoviricetes sp.]DAK15044.1 MAG TPA: hypothetical protein [Caudoviricetes sp.]DAK18629.1 MAG TPA: hypothetical protein [Caudoviricetes sp.]DAN83858.1 MAG TPA: hypothetical protein [Caudoviricetes sp.]DAR09355.1 MAG TPA: hypothetical protein [Caudoviricetes sp.]
MSLVPDTLVSCSSVKGNPFIFIVVPFLMMNSCILLPFR